MGNLPDYNLCIRRNDGSGRSVQIGCAWVNEKSGAISIKLDPGSVIHWRDMDDCYLSLFKNKKKKGSDKTDFNTKGVTTGRFSPEESGTEVKDKKPKEVEAKESSPCPEDKKTCGGCVQISEGMAGYFAVLLHVDQEDGFCEPWSSGVGRYADREVAVLDGKSWASAEGIPFRDKGSGKLESEGDSSGCGCPGFPTGG